MTTEDESSFEALRHFRALSGDEKIECLFMDLQDIKKSGAATATHLGILNGTTSGTAALINTHLALHKTWADQTAGVSIFGSNVQRAIVAASAAIALALAIFNILEHL